MMVIHYRNGKSYSLPANGFWKDVPNKDEIAAVEIRSEFDGKSYTLRGSEAFNYVFFGQQAGYSSHGLMLRHKLCGTVEPFSTFMEEITIIHPGGTRALEQCLKLNCHVCGKALRPEDMVSQGILNQPFEEEEVGMVINPDGNCIVLDVTKTGAKVFYTTLGHLGMAGQSSLGQLGISLDSIKTAGVRR